MCILNLSTTEIKFDLSRDCSQEQPHRCRSLAKTETGQSIATAVMLRMMLLFKCFDRPEVSPPYLTFSPFLAMQRMRDELFASH